MCGTCLPTHLSSPFTSFSSAIDHQSLLDGLLLLLCKVLTCSLLWFAKYQLSFLRQKSAVLFVKVS
jgi:hypothetical protein